MRILNLQRNQCLFSIFFFKVHSGHFGMEPYFSTGFLNGSSHVFYYIYQDICSDMRFVIIKNLF